MFYVLLMLNNEFPETHLAEGMVEDKIKIYYEKPENGIFKKQQKWKVD